MYSNILQKKKNVSLPEPKDAFSKGLGNLQIKVYNKVDFLKILFATFRHNERTPKVHVVKISCRTLVFRDIITCANPKPTHNGFTFSK